eukprot:CAMPEP_0202450630 /NCGR_PEP_ID=MMETSP1360-20130828/9221_1 /ASSEMBLY_ACC=CAM_ASM_000848 /TAXON_ID=515479 /ORGANISM="Licmophora paradoxa, Strain CCMP2313" /LENGTH=278 /DNA_ID=CAMNT_0049068979 /DNA_START=166 /DNA_END=1002 /DNA_ORIENTATION=-
MVQGCFIQGPAFYTTSLTPLIVLMFAPILVVIVSCTFLLGFLVYKVQKQSKAGNKWRFSSVADQSYVNDDNCSRADSADANRSSIKRRKKTRTDEMQRQVVLQAVFYLCAFYLTWPLMMVTIWRTVPLLKRRNRVYLYAVLMVLTPLQGFFNCLIFFRIRMLRAWQKHWKKRKQHERVDTFYNILSSFLFLNQKSPSREHTSKDELKISCPDLIEDIKVDSTLLQPHRPTKQQEMLVGESKHQCLDEEGDWEKPSCINATLSTREEESTKPLGSGRAR